jgi:predicted dehydrogenase
LTNIRWGIFGTGAMAELFAEALGLAKGAELHGVASRTRARAEIFASQFAARHAYSSYEQLLDLREASWRRALLRLLQPILDDSSIELVANLTSPASHFAIWKTFLEADKHVTRRNLSLLHFERQRN